MRRARFRDPSGAVRIGEWSEGGIEAAGVTFDVDEVDLLAPVDPTKVVALHSNYRGGFESPADTPDRPKLFWKGGPNVVSGPGDAVAIPDTGAVHAEPELAVAVGEQCRNVAPAEAMAAVAGFTCANDLSDRSQTNEPRQKSFDGAAPLGPALVPPESVPPSPTIRLSIDGEPVGEAADEFVFSPGEVVASVASRITLERGDVVLLGNPGLSESVGDGDAVAIEVQGIGRLEHGIEVRA